MFRENLNKEKQVASSNADKVKKRPRGQTREVEKEIHWDMSYFEPGHHQYINNTLRYHLKPSQGSYFSSQSKEEALG